LKTVLNEVMAFIMNACAAERSTPVLVAHNGHNFDIPILARELARYNCFKYLLA
jgi:predicted PolB exonuclease-like 3'-5' exonuclease